MKKILCLIALFSTSIAYTQISINDSDLPSGGDTLRVSQTFTSLSFDEGDTGPNHSWDFTDLTPVSQAIDSFLSMSNVSLIYSAVFTNFLGGDNADFGRKNPFRVDSIMGLTIEDRFDFYAIESNSYTNLGFGASINGFPTPIKYDDSELIFNLPLEYMDSDSDSFSYSISIPSLGYYGQEGSKSYEVDGWGSITTPYGTFDALRVHTIINTTDTISLDSTAGFTIPRPTQHLFEWYSNEKEIPVLKIETTEIFGNNTVTNITYLDSIRDNLISVQEEKLEGCQIVYNSRNNELILLVSESNHFDNGVLNIYSMNGAKVLSTSINSSKNFINLPDLDKGLYIAEFLVDSKHLNYKFIK